MAALWLGVALGGVLVALGGFLVAALNRARARDGPEGPRLGREARSVAHRGGAGERIENTMEAFENAVSEGCDWLELDVRRSRDGVVVVCHDRDLRRQSGRGGDVTRLDYQDLPPYQSPLEVEFDPGHFSSGRDRRIPRLVEVFRRFPTQPISVEIKDDDDDLIDEVAALVRTFDRAPITLWASFREPILRKCRRAHPSMPFCFSLERGLLTLLLWSCGLLPLLRMREAALLCPLPSSLARTWRPLPHTRTGSALRRAVSRLYLRPPLLRHLRSRGVQVWLWVANEEREMAEAFGLGATGVISDYPGRVRRFLRDTPTPATPTPATPTGATPKRDTSIGDTTIEATPMRDTPIWATPMRDTPTRDTPIKDTPIRDTPIRDTPIRDTPIRDTPMRDTPIRDTPIKDTPIKDTPIKDTPIKDTPIKDTPIRDTPIRDTPIGDTPTGDTPMRDTPIKDTPMRDTPIRDTPIKATPIKATPTGDTPIRDTPIGDTPIRDTPMRDTPIRDTPIEATPIKDTPIGDTPIGDTPIRDTPIKDTPIRDTPIRDTPIRDTPIWDTPIRDTPMEATPTRGRGRDPRSGGGEGEK